MDAVRFGRVLGVGARALARTAVAAVDAATAPSPPSSSTPGARVTATPQEPTILRPPRSLGPRTAASGQSGRAAATTARTTAAGIREGARRFGREVWNPLRRASGVLWLEVTGVFFGIFALFALGAAWKLRGAWHVTSGNAAEHQRLLGAVAMLVVFGYFTVSSFVRASRRGRAR